MFKNAMAFCCLLATMTVAAATYTWTGAGDATKWTDKANWGGSGYPTGGDTAKFTGDAKNIAEDFEIGAGVLTVDVASGKDVYLKGVVSGAGGVKKTGSGKFRLYNQANTYTGTHYHPIDMVNHSPCRVRE